MTEIYVIIASIFALIGNYSYLRDVMTKKVKPHPYTWFVWSIVSGITFFGQVVKGAGIGAVPTGIAELCTLFIFVFSLQYGFKNITRSDTYYLFFALLGLFAWLFLRDPTLSVIIVVLIDVVAFIPTLRKTQLHPTSESPVLYSMNVARHILTLLSLRAFNIATAFHSLAMTCVNGYMTYILVRKK